MDDCLEQNLAYSFPKAIENPYLYGLFIDSDKQSYRNPLIENTSEAITWRTMTTGTARIAPKGPAS